MRLWSETKNNMLVDHRPWGTYEVLLDSDDCKVKRITVFENQRLSYQYHNKREEYWLIVKGEGVVVLNGDEISCKEGDQIHVPLKMKHRICNTGTHDLVFIEIQRGDYFGEDDIVRLEDDYQRS